MQIDLLKIFSELNLKPQQIKQIELYRQKLTCFNQRFSLVSRHQPTKDKGQRTAGVLGILDSLVAGRILLDKAQPGPIADIGSGAGFPGLILAILDQDREFWLYEINKKKASFLEYMAHQLNLKNIKIKNIPIQQEKTKSLTQGVSKAFFSLSKRLECTKQVFKEGGCYYHLQSLSYKKEWDTMSIHLKARWDLVSAEKYSYLPWLSRRVLLRIDKKGGCRL